MNERSPSLLGLDNYGLQCFDQLAGAGLDLAGSVHGRRGQRRANLGLAPARRQAARASTDKRSFALWSLATGKPLFELDALVGVRAVYAYHPARGDIVFDGGGGLMRVLPSLEKMAHDFKALHPVVDGTAVRLDDRGKAVGSATAPARITSDPAACPR